MFALLRPAMQSTESTTFNGACDDELQPMLITVLFNQLQH